MSLVITTTVLFGSQRANLPGAFEVFASEVKRDEMK
jgi:hypothetical protein